MNGALSSGVDEAPISSIRDGFRSFFRRHPDVELGAPGRVNLIGEHTDYNGGFVLPMAIPQRTRVQLATNRDAIVRVVSREMARGDDAGLATFELGQERVTRGWTDYVQGVTVALRQSGLGGTLRGFDAWIESDVPVGAGLSSSAALEVALLRALREAFALPLEDVTIARLGRAAETDFVGAPVGIMDQMACSLADEHTALFLDTRTLAYERIALPASGALVVIDSGVAHDHAAGDYRTRRAECDRAASLLGVAELRDVTSHRFADVAALPPPLDRRARHVITENRRVLDAVDAMKAGNLPRLGALFTDSHRSMKDDFEVSVPAVDRLVALADEQPEVFGARLTGGGFGGAVVVLVRAESAGEVAMRIVAAANRSAASATPVARVLVPVERP
ncbi:MAG: galactokinase [Myxococcota bacterium]|nr:galactokinase [Myxococcota bacterium]